MDIENILIEGVGSGDAYGNINKDYDNDEFFKIGQYGFIFE